MTLAPVNTSLASKRALLEERIECLQNTASQTGQSFHKHHLSGSIPQRPIPVKGNTRVTHLTLTATKHFKRWFNEDIDIRKDRITNEEIIAFIKENEAKSVVMADRIMGCPHEEGVDYPFVIVARPSVFRSAKSKFTLIA